MFLKNYFNDLRLSFSSIIYYFKVTNSPWHRSLRFFLLSFLFLGIGYSWKINSKDLPQLESNIRQTLTEIKDNYPDNLIVSYQNNKLELKDREISLNDYSAEELMLLFGDDAELESIELWSNDFYVNWPTALSTTTASSGLSQYLAIYTSNVDENYLNQLKETSNSLLLVSPDKFLINDRGVWLEYLWADFELADFSFDKEQVINSINKWLNNDLKQGMDNLKTAVFIFMPIFLIISKLLLSFFYALLLWFLTNLSLKKNTYLQSCKLTWHIFVVAQTIKLLTSLLYPENYINMFSLSFWAISFLILISEKKLLNQIRQISDKN